MSKLAKACGGCGGTGDLFGIITHKNICTEILRKPAERRAESVEIATIEEKLLKLLDELLFEVQYAKLGSKTEVRKKYSKLLLTVLTRGKK